MRHSYANPYDPVWPRCYLLCSRLTHCVADTYERREMIHNAHGTPGDVGRVAQTSNTHRPASFGDSTSRFGRLQNHVLSYTRSLWC